MSYKNKSTNDIVGNFLICSILGFIILGSLEMHINFLPYITIIIFCSIFALLLEKIIQKIFNQNKKGEDE